LIDEPTVTSIAAEYGRTPEQVLVRWNLQLNNVVVSRSSKPERVAENLEVRQRVERVLRAWHEGMTTPDPTLPC